MAAQRPLRPPDKAFFIYFAPGALFISPHHVFEGVCDKYKGKFFESRLGIAAKREYY